MISGSIFMALILFSGAWVMLEQVWHFPEPSWQDWARFFYVMATTMFLLGYVFIQTAGIHFYVSP